MKITKSLMGAALALFTTVTPAMAETIEIDNKGMGVTSFSKLLNSGIQLAMILAALLCFVFLIWGGIQWITSGGDKSNYEAARNRITAALVGLAIVAASWAIMSLMETFFGIKILSGFEIPTASN